MAAVEKYAFHRPIEPFEALRKVRWMYRVELYVRVRRDCKLDDKSTREASSVFRGHTGTPFARCSPTRCHRKQKCPMNCDYGTPMEPEKPAAN